MLKHNEEENSRAKDTTVTEAKETTDNNKFKEENIRRVINTVKGN